MKNRFVWAGACLFALLVVSCAGNGDASGRLRVVATTTQIGDLAANVGGDLVSLTTLLKPNQDAHDFEPAPSQIRRLHEASVVLRNGIGLDIAVNKFIGGKAEAVIVTEGISLRPVPGEPERDGAAAREASGHDPHVWFAVGNAKRMVDNIALAFASADPANASAYRANAARYNADLDALDGRIKAAVEVLPAACRKLVTNHDTLYYYATAYGFEVVGSIVPSASSEAKPSAKDVADIVKKIREENVPAIFAEASINPGLIQQVGKEAGVRVVDDLYGDSLGPKSSDGATYITMMEADTSKIVTALKDCEAPRQ